MTNSNQNEARKDGRQPSDLRPVRMTTGYTKYAEGSVLVEMGETRVLCTASVEDRVPPFLKGKGVGWITAEYSMLPRATESRTQREIGRGGPSGRTHEIQRLNLARNGVVKLRNKCIVGHVIEQLDPERVEPVGERVDPLAPRAPRYEARG